MKLYRLGDNLCKLIAGKNLFIFNAHGIEEKFLNLIVVVGSEFSLFGIDENALHSLQYLASYGIYSV